MAEDPARSPWLALRERGGGHPDCRASHDLLERAPSVHVGQLLSALSAPPLATPESHRLVGCTSKSVGIHAASAVRRANGLHVRSDASAAPVVRSVGCKAQLVMADRSNTPVGNVINLEASLTSKPPMHSLRQSEKPLSGTLSRVLLAAPQMTWPCALRARRYSWDWLRNPA